MKDTMPDKGTDQMTGKITDDMKDAAVNVEADGEKTQEQMKEI